MSQNKVGIVPVPLLSSINDYTDFSCGVSLIDDFLLNSAEKFDAQYKTKTTTFWIHNQIVGFYTANTSILTLKPSDLMMLRKSGIEISDSEDQISNEVIVPTINLGFFAVDHRFQQRGIGTLLLHYFLATTALAYLNSSIGFAGVALSALPNAAEFYQGVGFEFLGGIDYDNGPFMTEYPMFINMPTILEQETDHLGLRA